MGKILCPCLLLASIAGASSFATQSLPGSSGHDAGIAGRRACRLTASQIANQSRVHNALGTARPTHRALGAMTKYLVGLNVRSLSHADHSSLCGQMFEQFTRVEPAGRTSVCCRTAFS